MSKSTLENSKRLKIKQNTAMIEKESIDMYFDFRLAELFSKWEN